MGGFVQISFGWIGSILVPYFRHIIILVILRLNEGFFFRWEVVALFGSCYSERWSSVFLGLVCFRLSLPHGASCSVYSVLFFVCAGVLFSFVLLLSEARRRFFPFFWSAAGGIRLVQARKKNFYLIFLWSSIVYCSFRNLRPLLGQVIWGT